MDLSHTPSPPDASETGPVWLRFALAGLALGLGTWGLAWLLGGGVLPALLFHGAALGLATHGMRATYPHAQAGLCNLVTLARLGMTSALFGALFVGTPAIWPTLSIALLAFAMDGADGWLARRAGLSSAFGARFDMEVDSAFALVLAALAVQEGLSPAVLLLGLPRYLFWGAGLAFPDLNGPLPERFSRKVVCVVQIAVLIFLLVPWIGPELRHVAALGAGGLVIWSFALDIAALWRARA